MSWDEKLYRGHGRKLEELEQEWLDPLSLKGPERECELPENLGLALYNEIYLGDWVTFY